MKTPHVVITVILFVLSGLFATAQSYGTVETDSAAVTQTADKKLFEKFEKGLIYGFGSDVTGVVESSIYNAVNYKIVYPEFESANVLNGLNDIAVNNKNHSIRYKAYLALRYYKTPEQFGEKETLLSMLDHNNQNDIFFYLQEAVQADQFTSTIN